MFKGSNVALITPFKNNKVDEEKYIKIINFHLENGTNGLVPVGTTGESPTLSHDEHQKLIELCIKESNGKIPVIAGTGSQSIIETKILTNHAVKAGVDSLLIVTPYYIKPPQRGLIEYYLELTEKIDIPWMIYHIPGRTAVNVTLETMKILSDKSANFVGMKHAVNDLGFVTECLSAFGPDFKIFVGLEELSFPMLSIGACGLMNAVGNLRPNILSEMCEAVWNKNNERGLELHHQLLEINQAVFYDTNPIPIKYMMKKLGIMKNNEHRLPMMSATVELEKRLDIVLRNSGLLED